MKKNNIILTTLAMLSVCTVSFGQVKITDQFGNLKTVQGGAEPWNVVGGKTPSSSNNSDIYQTGKVGIGDFSATAIDQQLDVNGNARIRTLANGTTFTNIVMADANGVLGKVAGQLVPPAAGATTDNNSTAMFVHKKYTLVDEPNATPPNPASNARSTGFSSDIWDAVGTIVSIKRLATAGDAALGFDNYKIAIELSIDETNKVWVIKGNLDGFPEEWMYDVLFIKKPAIPVDNEADRKKI